MLRLCCVYSSRMFLCVFLAYVTHILCILCIYFVYSSHMLCIYFVYGTCILDFSCMLHVYFMYSSCSPSCPPPPPPPSISQQDIFLLHFWNINSSLNRLNPETPKQRGQKESRQILPDRRSELRY